MNNNLPHAKPTRDGRTDRMDDQIALWGRFGRVASKVGADDFWVLGDLFDHGRVDAITLAETAKVMARFPVPVRLLPGNHDAHTVTGGRFNLEAFGHFTDNIVYVGGRPPTPWKPRPWLVFWPVEFMPLEATLDVLKGIRQQIKDGIPETEGERMDVLLLHNSIVGCSHAGWVCDSGLDAEVVCEGFDCVLAGHFHDSQTFGPDGRGMYLSAPMHHRFDDIGRKAGFWALTFKEGAEVKKQFFKGKAPSFCEADWERGKLIATHDPAPGDYLRIQARATHAAWAGGMKAELEAEVARLLALGIRASYKHVPMYHHEARIKTHGDMAVATMERNIESYVDSVEVDTTGLDLARLKSVGLGLLSEARRAK